MFFRFALMLYNNVNRLFLRFVRAFVLYNKCRYKLLLFARCFLAIQHYNFFAFFLPFFRPSFLIFSGVLPPRRRGLYPAFARPIFQIIKALSRRLNGALRRRLALSVAPCPAEMGTRKSRRAVGCGFASTGTRKDARPP